MVRPGYKQTEVGEIPEDWDVTEIGNLNPYVTSGSRGWAGYYSTEGSPFIRITNMSRERIQLDFTKLQYVKLPPNENEGKRTELIDGDVLISITADIGISSYVDSDLVKPAYINQHVSLVRFNPKLVNSKFVSYFLASEGVQKLFTGSTDQGAKAGLNLDAIRKIKVVKPELQEQKAIAKALSDVDELIVSLEKLIAKKCDIKTATMQQLLTGKKRLPGFGEGKGYKQSELGEIPEDWEIKSYGEIFSFLSTASNSRDDLSENGDIFYIHYGDIHTKFHFHVDFKHDQIPKIDSQKLKGASFIQDGDLIMADASEDYAGVGKCVEVTGLNNKRAISGLHTFLLRDAKNAFSPGFRGYLHAMTGVKKSFDRLATGLKVYGLSKNNLKQVVVPIPPYNEQQCVIEVLSSMETDIEALTLRLNKTQSIKQGMMQELLTGRTRLIES